MKFIGIIPARYASTRFPGKPLADMGGKTMIQRVFEQASLVLEHVVVATDDQRIVDAVLSFGGNVVLTSSDHTSGTDRCYEAFQKIGKGYDIIINIQGDEPFIQPEQIKALMRCFDSLNTQIATLVKPLDATEGHVLLNPNTPKVVISENNEALYFSRSPIPYLRGSVPIEEWCAHHIYYKHIGMYAYHSDILRNITQLAPSTLEKIESLEQLRWLSNGYNIKVAITSQETIGIDTPDDLVNAIKFLQNVR